jgi:hypothetical protein
MGTILSLFASKNHAQVDVECKGCAFHADDKSSSSEDSPILAPAVKRHATELKLPKIKDGDD